MSPPTPVAPAPAPTSGSIPAPVLPKLSNREVRELKGRAQRLDAVTRLGKGGVSDEFIAGVDRELARHGLIKVKLTELKEQRFEVADQMAARTQAYLIGVIGHVVVLYRPKPEVDPSTPAPVSAPKATPTPSARPQATAPKASKAAPKARRPAAETGRSSPSRG